MGLHPFTAKGAGSDPGCGTRVPHTTQCDQIKILKINKTGLPWYLRPKRICLIVHCLGGGTRVPVESGGTRRSQPEEDADHGSNSTAGAGAEGLGSQDTDTDSV